MTEHVPQIPQNFKSHNCPTTTTYLIWLQMRVRQKTKTAEPTDMLNEVTQCFNEFNWPINTNSNSNGRYIYPVTVLVKELNCNSLHEMIYSKY